MRAALKTAAAACWLARVEIACDATALIGAALVVRGVAGIYEPAAFIVGGVALMGLAVVWTRR